MYCSNCSEIVHPIVAFDLDGTTGVYHEFFTEFAEMYMGSPLPHHYDGSVPFWQHLGMDILTYRKIKLAYRQGGMKRAMPVHEGAGLMFHVARSMDAEIWITTTRPYLRLDNIDPDTQHWLERHGLSADFMLYDEDKYGQLHSRVDPARVVAIVEDLPEQWDRAAELFGAEVPIMVYREHNATERRYPGWDHLNKVASQIRQRILIWKEENNEHR